MLLGGGGGQIANQKFDSALTFIDMKRILVRYYVEVLGKQENAMDDFLRRIYNNKRILSTFSKPVHVKAIVLTNSRDCFNEVLKCKSAVFVFLVAPHNEHFNRLYTLNLKSIKKNDFLRKLIPNNVYIPTYSTFHDEEISLSSFLKFIENASV